MPGEVKTKRAYNSEGRRQRAVEKKGEILGVARDLFLELGYRSTTMEAIAARSGVALETVYAGFGNKSKLFGRVVDVAIVGDTREVPLLDREWVSEVRNEPDPRKRLQLLAALSTSVLARVGPLHALVRSAMDGDAELMAFHRQQTELRYRGQLEFVRLLEDALRPDLTLEAARDIYWALASPELHHLLTVERGWPARQYKEWLVSVLEPALLRHPEPIPG